MVERTPVDRPDALEVLALWKEIRETVWTMKREWRPRPRFEHPVETVMLDSVCFRELFALVAECIARRLPV